MASLGPRLVWQTWLVWQTCPAEQRLWSDFHEQKSENQATAATPRCFSKEAARASPSVFLLAV